jgi:hypothetical protein
MYIIYLNTDDVVRQLDFQSYVCENKLGTSAGTKIAKIGDAAYLLSSSDENCTVEYLYEKLKGFVEDKSEKIFVGEVTQNVKAVNYKSDMLGWLNGC